MTTTYDPFHPKYFDEADLRHELTRVYDLCHGCRLCFKFCSSFPTLFEFVDNHDDQDVSKLTAAEQDQVVHECFNCKLCYINCPYTPNQHEWQLDFPRLMMRADQVLHQKDKPLRTKVTDKALGSTDLLGSISAAAAPLANKAIAKPGSPFRKIIEATAGISRERILPPYAKQRFSSWFNKRTDRAKAAADATAGKAKAAIFATCIVEYQDTAVGKDLVAVYEHNGIECSLPEGQVCCGAPYLHQGDLPGFRKLARKNIPVLASAVRSGADIVVPQPTCGYVLKKDYLDYIGGVDAELVAENTYDACEYLMMVHKGEGTELSTEFPGEVPETTTYHAPCHLRAQEIGLKSRDVMKLTGTKLKVVAECSGIDGTWGLRAENLDASRKVAKKMATQIEKADSEAVAGDCTLANGAIHLETGIEPMHPLTFVARAYGLDTDS